MKAHRPRVRFLALTCSLAHLALGCSGSADAVPSELADTSTLDGARPDTGGIEDTTAVDSQRAPDTALEDTATGGDAVDSNDTAEAADVTDATATDATATDAADAPDAAPKTSNIKHVILIVQENHTFDAYFGRYCTAAPSSAPTCTLGPACCEAAPAKEPSGAGPVVLDDAENAGFDPNHTQACELDELDGGKLDHFVAGAKVASCSNAKNFAIANNTVVAPYHQWAASYALADRYFQSAAGQSSMNDMYFAEAQFVFLDNAYEPKSVGHGCSAGLFTGTPTITYAGRKTIADLLMNAGLGFAAYAEGYDAMFATRSAACCPTPPKDCTSTTPFVCVTPSACNYDPGDVPFEYYAQFLDANASQSALPVTMKDTNDLAKDLSGTLPAFAFVKPTAYHNEHPGFGTTISGGAGFVKGIVDQVLASKYANDTLILVTWDEGGGFFDHVPPPPKSTVDGQQPGTRVPLLAIGRFARKNEVSHVEMEHSSIVRFLEWNFLGATGQLKTRDAVVNNIGSLLDPAQVGVAVP
jgi:phospholipase C